LTMAVGMKELDGFIAEAINVLIEEAVKDAVEKAKVDLDRRIPEIVAGLSIRVMRNVQMRYGPDEIVIRVAMRERT